MKYLFYIKNIQEGYISGVINIEPDEHRNGWISYEVVHNPNGTDIISGGISAAHVFLSGLYDYGKDLEKLKS